MKKLIVLALVLIVVSVGVTACGSSRTIEKITIDSENYSVLNFKEQHTTLTQRAAIETVQNAIEKIDLKKAKKTGTENTLIRATTYTIKMYDENEKEIVYVFVGNKLVYKNKAYELTNTQQTELETVFQEQLN